MRLDVENYIPGGDEMIIERTISLNRCRIDIIDNRSTKYSFNKVWSLYGGDNKILINGPFFDMRSKMPVVHMKADGEVLCNPDYKMSGISLTKDGAPSWAVLPDSKKYEYFANTVLMEGGSKVNAYSHLDSDGTKKNPRYAARLAIGFAKDGLKVYYGSCESLWGLQNKLARRGWTEAIMLDGGASAAYRDSNHRLSPGRMIPYWLLITIVDNEPKGSKPMAPVHRYSLKKDGNKILSKNFKVREFRSRDGGDTIFIAPKLVEVLQQVRDKLGKPLIIDSGYRSELYNNKIGGVTYSQHRYGTAADVRCTGVKPETIQKIAEEILGETGGIGLYPWGVHVDVREVKYRWNG